MAGRRGRATAALLALVVITAAGYVTADVYDVAPGILTTDPPPEPPAPFPTAPGATDPPGAVDVLEPVDDAAPRPDPALVAAALAPALDDPRLGPSVSATVVDVVTGDVLLDRAATVPREPASVVKLLTAAAALHRLGPDSTTSTRAVQGVSPDEVVLLAGGDVLLSAGAGDPEATVGRAGLADLAAATAASLRQSGTTAVAVHLDDSLFTGPAMGPGWTRADLDYGFVALVSAVAVNAGRIRPENYAPRVPDPALSAATTFAELLAAQGIRVAGQVARAVAPEDPVVLAEVTSAPLEDVVAYTLSASDNNVAEVLARLVANDLGRQATFADAAGAVVEEVSLLGVDTTAVRLADGSGLGDGSLLPPSVLASLLAVAASPDHPELRPLLTGLPVATLNGTLVDRFGRQPLAAGLVRAKTGSLRNVTSLAGTVVDADGRLLAFALMADQVPATDPGREAADAVVAVLVGCGCR